MVEKKAIARQAANSEVEISGKPLHSAKAKESAKEPVKAKNYDAIIMRPKPKEEKKAEKTEEKKIGEKKPVLKTIGKIVKSESKAVEKKAGEAKSDGKKIDVSKKDSEKIVKKTVKKSVKKPKVEFPKKSKEIRDLQELIKFGRNHPVFRGRFGKRTIRRKSIEKWNKWRKPRGIDLQHEKEDGHWVDTGYRTANLIRFRHPSGYFDRLVRNVQEVELVSKQKDSIVRISSTVGQKKRKQILAKAHELKLRVVN